jgi:hypothetical protein
LEEANGKENRVAMTIRYGRELARWRGFGVFARQQQGATADALVAAG